MRIRLVMRLLTGAATLGFLGLLAAACGSDDPVAEPVAEPAGSETAGVAEADEGGTAESAASEPALAGPGDVPDLQMIDMHTGTTLGLQSVVDGQTPLLFWFWAPH